MLKIYKVIESVVISVAEACPVQGGSVLNPAMSHVGVSVSWFGVFVSRLSVPCPNVS